MKALNERGVIVAVCSKNDENNAMEVFEKHPEMVLRRRDIACFIANWDDKAANLRHIAAELNMAPTHLCSSTTIRSKETSFVKNTGSEGARIA